MTESQLKKFVREYNALRKQAHEELISGCLDPEDLAGILLDKLCEEVRDIKIILKVLARADRIYYRKENNIMDLV